LIGSNSGTSLIYTFFFDPDSLLTAADFDALSMDYLSVFFNTGVGSANNTFLCYISGFASAF